MKQDAPEHTLDKLRIAKDQRPASEGRPWVFVTLIVLVVLCVAGGAGFWYYETTGVNIVAAMSEKPVAVRTYTIPREPTEDRGEITLVANGRIVSDVRVNVATKVSGQITSLHVEQGDDVEKDQILARIEEDVYEAQRDEAQASVEQLRYSIAQTRANHERDLAAIEEARSDFAWRKYNHDRIEQLARRNQASDVELTESRLSLDGAAAALRKAEAAAQSAESAINVIEAELKAAEAVLRFRQKRLDDCAIRAPISGVVLERNAQVGDFLAAEGGIGANANAQLVSIADMTRLRVEIDVSERDVHRVSAGQRARITPDAYKSDVFDGHVMWLDPIGDYARAIVQVKVRIENPNPQLRIEGSAKVEFLGEKPLAAQTGDAKRFWLPLDAVKIPDGDGDAVVFTVIDQRAVANVVRIGARTTKTVEVLSGVYPGMELIADHLEDIADGTLVGLEGALAP